MPAFIVVILLNKTFAAPPFVKERVPVSYPVVSL